MVSFGIPKAAEKPHLPFIMSDTSVIIFSVRARWAKFYFVVDRLDLLTQASEEFVARGLHVEKVNSKEDFIKNIKTIGTSNNSGEDSITVVNIQKFTEESGCQKI